MSTTLSPFPIARLIPLWPASVPLICLAGTGRYAFVATTFTEVPWDTAAATRVGSGQADAPAAADIPFCRGLIGVVSYDQLAWPRGPATARVFRVEQALAYDAVTGHAFPTVAAPARPAAHQVDPLLVNRLAAALTHGAPTPPSPSAPPLTLIADAPGEAYEALVRQALADIRAGRYYQINLLRFFRPAPPAPDLAWLLARLERWGGPFAALFALPGLTVASFSPERFVRVTPRPEGEPALIETCPIKGTAARVPGDPVADRAAALALVHSRKDLAELHMIVDLMRNDLNSIAVPGTVEVPAADRLVTVANVHHLEAQVVGRLPPGLTLGELLAAVGPGGSVTGAPKREVMAAIRAYEGRSRGYFMGHAFYLDERGGFDSSILIRTLVQDGSGAFEFAAGSGIVIGSDPAAERREIDAKGRVVTS